MWCFPKGKIRQWTVNSLKTRIHEEFFGGRPLKDEVVLYKFNKSSMEPEPEILKQNDFQEDLVDEDYFVYALQ
jgi:MarR-like DNA-binding transcriptional regulator SgrR of sgrS sRNA